MGARADDVLFVDNRPENTDAAQRLGMRAILHSDTRATIAKITGWLSADHDLQQS
jgi:FMN phosphatase YigB (HAD superfamily)